ncbi:polyprenyl synthetase [Natrinema versiforme]|uniref:Polyprenyl synthetase n=1 Tax=Natrinema versiforme TaxID=88724 RepID=A0A4P8WS35_9EURY|nr:polyprenyl synthetase [Natrinema versiforme]QCS44871.1 polyprenyl synthetase [Natrinema versiforme]
MTRTERLSERRLEIDRRLEEALEQAGRDRLGPVRATMTDRDDRRYGQLVAQVHDSIAATPARETVLPAATAIELFRGYVRLRAQLLCRLGDEDASVQWDVTSALLASDYLYTTAYSTLGTLDDDRIGSCFETLASVSASVIEALGTAESQSTVPATDYCSLIDETAGSLGRGSALVGATLADIDEQYRERVATVGRGFGTVSRIQFVLASDAGALRTGSSSSTVRRLRRHATRRLTEVDRALDELSPVADVAPVRAFVREAAPDRLPKRCRD